MDRFGARCLGRRDDLLDHEVGLCRCCRADVDGFVGHLDVQGIAVGIGVDGDGLDAEAACGLDHAAGDLAAIGDQDLLEHRRAFPLGAGHFANSA